MDDDDDPLDVLVLMQEPVAPFSFLRIKPIGTPQDISPIYTLSRQMLFASLMWCVILSAGPADQGI